jgi:hypothetical protein
MLITVCEPFLCCVREAYSLALIYRYIISSILAVGVMSTTVLLSLTLSLLRLVVLAAAFPRLLLLMRPPCLSKSEVLSALLGILAVDSPLLMPLPAEAFFFRNESISCWIKRRVLLVLVSAETVELFI